MSMEEKASDESSTTDKLEAPVKITVSADAYYKVDQYRHLRERQHSSHLFQQWLHGRGLACDAKLIQKVVSNFFNRPWDGLVFANSKSVEDSESAAATGADSVRQTRLPQVTRAQADAQQKGPETQTSSHFTTGKLELRAFLASIHAQLVQMLLGAGCERHGRFGTKAFVEQ